MDKEGRNIIDRVTSPASEWTLLKWSEYTSKEDLTVLEVLAYICNRATIIEKKNMPFERVNSIF